LLYSLALAASDGSLRSLYLIARSARCDVRARIGHGRHL